MDDLKLMKGLIYKDIQLLLQSKKFLLALLSIFIFAKAYPGYILFVLSYTTMVFNFMGFNSLSYEEYDNALPYLFTLPINRKLYVKEKYLFAFGLTFIGWFSTFIICYFMQNEGFLLFLIQGLSILLSMVFFQILLIPIQIKYGGEKSRIVLFSIIGVILGICAFLAKIINNLQPSEENLILLENIWNNIISYGGFLGIGLFILTFIVSYKLSIKFIEEKEY